MIIYNIQYIIIYPTLPTTFLEKVVVVRTWFLHGTAFDSIVVHDQGMVISYHLVCTMLTTWSIYVSFGLFIVYAGL